MAAPCTTIFALVLSVIYFVCITSHPARENSVRLKRDLSDDDIILGLKMYESKMSRLQRRVTKQINVINKQKKKIADLQLHLKHKGGNHEVDDLRAKIASQADEAIKNLQFASLETLGRGTENEVKGQTDFLKAIKKDNEIVRDVLQRIWDNRLICRDLETEWAGKAMALIKDLSNHYVNCGTNEFLQTFYLERKDGSRNSKMRYKYRCCRMSLKDKWQKPDNM